MKKPVEEDIVSGYGRRTVLCGVHLTANAGECIGIVGENGCGKSTLLNILAGLRTPKSGGIYFDGQKASGHSGIKIFRQYIGYVPQDSNLIPELSVWDNLLIWYQNKGLLEHEINEGFLKVLGIDHRVRVKAGRRTGAGLDLLGKADIRSYLVMYREIGGTILLATHEEVDLDICDRVYVLKGGICKEIDREVRGEKLLMQLY